MKMTVESVRMAMCFQMGRTIDPPPNMPGTPVVTQMGHVSTEAAQVVFDKAMAEAGGDVHKAAHVMRRMIGVCS